MRGLLSFVVVLLALAAWAQELPFNIVRAPGTVALDGRLSEWVLSAPVTYEVDGNATDRRAKTYAMWDDAKLYLAYVVRDASPLKNGGDDPTRAFKTGDSLHFYFSTAPEVTAARPDGGPQDYHVLLAMLGGKPVVHAFRQKKPGVTTSTVMASPATRIELAWTGPVPGAEMVSRVEGDRYTVEAAIPWAFFDDFRPAANAKVAADAAVNFSDVTGTTNTAKVWWHRGSSQILDVPSELRFERNLWGTAIFRAPGERPLVIDNENTYVTPAPGAVALDGKLDDWDMSTAYGPQYVDPILKEQNNVTWAMMYDAQALYLGAIFHAAQPFNNTSGVENTWWLGDSLEFRLALNPRDQGNIRENVNLCTFGVWYNAVENKDYVALQRSFKFVTGDVSSITVKSAAIPGGRSFEVRVPWSILQNATAPKAGEQVLCTLAGIWKNGLRAYGMGSISSFRGVDNWGQAHFLAEGKQPLVFRNLIQPQIVELPLNAGKYKATITAPAKGLLSAGVYRDGKLLRTLAAGREVAAGPVEIGWDGKDDAGVTLPAGAYELRALVNAGLRAEYVTSFGSPGKPPHDSTHPKRGWGGVWDNVQDIASDATGVYPIWGVEEGDGGLMHVDENGNFLWRQHLPLAQPGRHVAVAVNAKYVYVGVDPSDTKGGKAGLWRVRADTGNYVPFPHDGSDPLAFNLDGISKPVSTEAACVGGLAATATTLYASAHYQNAVIAYDAETGVRIRAYDVPAPRGICLDGDGLLVVTGNTVLRLNLATGALAPVVARNLVAPWRVAVDGKGHILVTDRGTAMQVKRFDRNGRLSGTFGKPGGRSNNGTYHPDALLDPAGITVAPSGKVFYSEDAMPRAFTRLSATLKYETQWVGPWYMSGEVCVDPQRPEHAYLWDTRGFTRFRLDYAKKTYTPDALWCKFALPEGKFGRWFPRIVNHGGNTYVFTTGTPTSLFRIDGDRMTLVASIGAERKGPSPWVFTDLNDNGVADGNETVYPPAPTDPRALFTGSYWGGSIDERDLTIYLFTQQYGANNSALAVTPTFVKGVPVYDLTKVRVVPLIAARRNNSNASSFWHTPDGGVVGNADANGSDPRGIGHSSHLSDVFAFRLDKDGNLLWRAGKKASGIAKNGEFYGRACGLGGPIGSDYFDFVDENGQDKVYTMDGLFAGNLLDDSATAEPSATTLMVEHFNSIVYQNAKDKEWYFVAGGGGYSSIWRIAGLETITRHTAKLTVE
jgi:hypothetical protein